jgi:Lrp/AsnC family leucine-responsive transcriptional regulator
MVDMTLNLHEETTRLLDQVGWAILAELQADARISYSELGRRVGLTPPAVTERVRRMEEAGIISGYHVRVNPAAVGLGITAMIMMEVEDCRWIADQFAVHAEENLPEILECHRVTGSFSFVIKAAVSSVNHLEDLIDRLSKLGDVTTSIVLSSPIPAQVVDRRMLGWLNQ